MININKQKNNYLSDEVQSYILKHYPPSYNKIDYSDSVVDDNILYSKYIESFPFKYKSFSIPKKRGGHRIISQPTKELKDIQRYICSLLSDNFYSQYVCIHPKALAYQKHKNIKDNAILHVQNQYILKLDITDFFHSIIPSMFFDSIKKNGMACSDNDIFLLKNLLFYRKNRYSSKLSLSIGAPSSPFISNVVMYHFDLELDELCNKKQIVYSRYADDMIFSTNKKNVLYSIISHVNILFTKYFGNNLHLNNAKTIFSSKAHNRHVTGITLANNNKISIGRKNKKKLYALMHQFILNKLNYTEIQSLYGFFNFCKNIDPLLEIRLKHKYGLNILSDLKSKIKKV